MYLDIVKKYPITELSVKLDVSSSTVKRWLELENVPPSYNFDLLRIDNQEIDYTKFKASEKDQFYTPVDTAKRCYLIFCDVLKKHKERNCYYYIEPSAGDGSFLKQFPPKKRIGLDIEPRDDEIVKVNYFDWKPDKKRKYVVFGNPPFGLRGNLALRFINHSYEFADYVCFILPQLFESDGKGVPRKRVKGYHLIYSDKIDSKFLTPDNKEITVNCIFQIWSKYHQNTDYTINTSVDDNIKVLSLSDGGTSSSTRNKKMLNKCDVYLPSTCYGKENMRVYTRFDDLPNRKGYGVCFKNDIQTYVNICNTVDWSEVAYQSTNSAYNLRKSQIIEHIK